MCSNHHVWVKPRKKSVVIIPMANKLANQKLVWTVTIQENIACVSYTFFYYLHCGYFFFRFQNDNKTGENVEQKNMMKNDLHTKLPHCL